MTSSPPELNVFILGSKRHATESILSTSSTYSTFNAHCVEFVRYFDSSALAALRFPVMHCTIPAICGMMQLG
jgi:hypothetical protein